MYCLILKAGGIVLNFSNLKIENWWGHDRSIYRNMKGSFVNCDPHPKEILRRLQTLSSKDKKGPTDTPVIHTYLHQLKGFCDKWLLFLLFFSPRGKAHRSAELILVVFRLWLELRRDKWNMIQSDIPPQKESDGRYNSSNRQYKIWLWLWIDCIYLYYTYLSPFCVLYSDAKYCVWQLIYFVQ